MKFLPNLKETLCYTCIKFQSNQAILSFFAIFSVLFGILKKKRFSVSKEQIFNMNEDFAFPKTSDSSKCILDASDVFGFFDFSFPMQICYLPCTYVTPIFFPSKNDLIILDECPVEIEL